jgi:hypothetical protein
MDIDSKTNQKNIYGLHSSHFLQRLEIMFQRRKLMDKLVGQTEN